MNDGVIDSNVGGDLSLTVTSEIRSYLKETAKWAYFLSIVGFVMLAFIVVGGIFSATILGSSMSSLSPGMPGGAPVMMSGGLMMVVYLAIAALYFFPTLYLYRYAKKMKVALANDDQLFLAESFKNLKSMFKFMGILMAIILGFYGIIIILGLLFGAFASLQ